MDRIIRVKELCNIIGVCRGTVYNWVKSGTFPPPVSLGAHAVGWRTSEIYSWLEARV